MADLVERLLEHGLEQLELGAAMLEEAADLLRVVGRDAGDLLGQLVDIGRCADRAIVLENQAILRIEPLQLDVILEALTTGREDLGEDFRVEEERRADVEAVALRRLDRSRAPSDNVVTFVDRDLDAVGGQKQGDRQAPRSSTDDGDPRT